MAHKHLTACLLALAVFSAACAGDSDEAADEAQTAALAAARARTDSIRKARAAADTNGVQVAMAGAAAQPAADERSVLRESFAYAGGARDPFASLIDMKATGPELGNLQLVGVYLDVAAADNSVAVLREKDSGKRYKLHVGDQLGRMQVVQIAARDVTFRIEDFGYERQETLSLRKQEDMTP